jgi:hypothetical protein
LETAFYIWTSYVLTLYMYFNLYSFSDTVQWLTAVCKQLMCVCITICWRTVRCLCLCNIVAPKWWLQHVAETCRSVKIALCCSWSKTYMYVVTAQNMSEAFCLLSVLFNSAVICWCYTVWVMNEWAQNTGGMILTREKWSTWGGLRSGRLVTAWAMAWPLLDFNDVEIHGK